MKLLENSKLDAISSTLSTDTPICDLITRYINKLIYIYSFNYLFFLINLV